MANAPALWRKRPPSKAFQVLLVIVLGAPSAIVFMSLCLVVPMSILTGHEVSLRAALIVLVGLPVSGAVMLLTTGHLRQWLYLLPFVAFALSPLLSFPGLDLHAQELVSVLLGIVSAFAAAAVIRRYYARRERGRSGR